MRPPPQEAAEAKVRKAEGPPSWEGQQQGVGLEAPEGRGHGAGTGKKREAGTGARG